MIIKTLKGVLLLLYIFGCLQGHAQEILNEPAAKLDREKKYLFYFHGRFLENNPIGASHPQYGIYAYEKIKEAFSSRGFVVISEKRTGDTDVEQYAAKVVGQIQEMLKEVPASHITVVGGSKGSYIAQWVSTLLKNKEVNFVLLAGCRSDADKPDIHLYGNVLSIYEASDTLGQSCTYLKEVPNEIHHYKEIEVNLGIQHQIVYQPYAEWVNPTVEWAKQFSLPVHKDIQVKEIKKKVKNGNAYLIDVRTPEEYGQGHLQYSRNIDFKSEHFQSEIRKLDASKPVYLYCRSGNRSGKAELLLKDWGFSTPINIGGFVELTQKGLPIASSENK